MNKTIKSIFFFSLALPVTLVTGATIGLIAGFISNIIYLVLLFPLGMGFAAGFVLEKAIGMAKIRKAGLAVVLGSLMAIAVYGGYHLMKYVDFRSQFIFEMYQQIAEKTGISDPIVANVMVDYALEQETGFAGFPGYLLFTARQGITIGKAFRSGIHLGPVFTRVFWMVEWGIIGWVTVGKAKEAAARPFCEACGRWYGEEQHLGGVSAALAAELAGLFERRDFVRAGSLLEPDAALPSLEVYMRNCGNCNSSDAWIALKPVSVNPSGRMQFEPGTTLSIRPHEQANMLSALKFAADPIRRQA